MDVIIDTDVDFDDYMAMIYLLQHKEINVLGITVTGCGAAHLSKGVDNVRNMLTLFDAETQKIPVFAGATSPMIYSNVFPYDVRSAANAHYGVAFPAVNPNPYTENEASQWMAETITSAVNPIAFLLIGGGTNFAKALSQLNTNSLSNIGKVVMMGGNLLPEYISPGAQGNIQDTLGKTPYYTNAVAEWNIFVDVQAAQRVLSSGLDITLVALNACNDVPITQTFVSQLKEIDTSAATFVTQILDSPTIVGGIDAYLEFWDPLAASALVDETLVSTEVFSISIVQTLNEANDTSGKIEVDAVNGSPVKIAIAANQSAVFAQYLAAMAEVTSKEVAYV